MSAAQILARSRDVALRQLRAARTLDGAALAAATRERQDLLFELSLLDRTDVGTDLHAVLEELHAIDARLSQVLVAASAALAPILGRAPVTYAATGKWRS